MIGNKSKASVLVLLTLALTAYFHFSFDKKGQIEKKINEKSLLTTTIDMKKNKRKNSKEYLFIQSGNISELKNYLKSISKEQEVDSFKNILLSKRIVGNLSLDNKKQLFDLLSNYKTENKYVQVYINRVVPYIFKNNTDREFLALFKDYIIANDKTKNLVLLSEMKSWAVVPDFVINFAGKLLEPKQDHIVMNVISFYSNLNDVDQLKLFYSKIKKVYSQMSDQNKSLFQKISLLNAKSLDLEKKDFYGVLSEKGVEWSEVKVKFIQKYSLFNEKKEVLRKIASGNSSTWIKKQARTLLEQAR